MADNITALANFGSSPEWTFIAPGTGGSHPLDIAKSVLSETQLLATAFDENSKAINASSDHTPTGKAKRLADLGRSNLESLEKLRLRLSPVETAKGAAIAKAREKGGSTEDRLAALLMQTEIRRLLADQTEGNPNQVKITYRDALLAKDFATLDAIETAPMLWQGRPGNDDLEVLKAERLEVEIPELSQEVGYLSAALDDTGSLLADVERDLNRAAGKSEIDPIGAIADVAG
jgi:hypothetical protein